MYIKFKSCKDIYVLFRVTNFLLYLLTENHNSTETSSEVGPFQM